MKKTIIVIIILLLIAGCQKENKIEYQRFQNVTVEAGFDTEITLLAYTKNQNEFDEFFNMMKTEFYKYHQIFDIYNNYEGINNLKTVNDNAGKKPVEVDQFLIDVLKIVQEQFEYTHHQFDPTAGSVLKIWHKYREEGILNNTNNQPGRVPSKEEIETASQCVGWDLLEIDDEKNTIYLNKPCASLDLGGIAKGYAAEQVASTLEKNGLEYAVVNAGGNVRIINAKPDGQPWVVGIGYPSLIQKHNINLFKIDKTYSVVTSGDYQRFYQDENNTRYSHLIDMKTYFPGTNFRSVSVFTKNSTLGDLYSTTLYLMNYDEGKAFVQEHNKLDPDNKIDVLWVIDESNSTDINHPDFKKYVDFPELKFAMTSDLKSIEQK